MTTDETDYPSYRETPEGAAMPALERRIARALELPVPQLRMPELPDIDSGKFVAIKPRRRALPPVWLAMAASTALVALLAIGDARLFGGVAEHGSLAEDILAHLDHEPHALRVSDEAVSDARLTQIVPANLAMLDHSAGLITYAKTCKINGKLSPHLVIQGRNGPVTVILMPEERVRSAQTITGERINGVILPVGNGSIAIIGSEYEDLEPIQRRLIDSVTWSA